MKKLLFTLLGLCGVVLVVLYFWRHSHVPAANAGMNQSAAANSQSSFNNAPLQLSRGACVGNLKMLGLAMRIWSTDHSNQYPTSLVVMSKELNTPRVLICPGDKARQNYATLPWSEFRDDMTSFHYLAQPDDENYPDCISAFCPIHHDYLLADGSVHEIDPDKMHEVEQNGRWYLRPVDDSAK